jgi:hypothetical protein
MGRESRADLRAERDALAESAELAAKQLQTIASEIEYVIANLPRRTRNEHVATLQQQADRAQALANAFAAEERAPDRRIMRHLSEAKGAFGLALALALKNVVVGGLEHTGAEGVDAAMPQIAALIEQANEMADPKPSETDTRYEVGVKTQRARINLEPFLEADSIRMTQLLAELPGVRGASRLTWGYQVELKSGATVEQAMEVDGTARGLTERGIEVRVRRPDPD